MKIKIIENEKPNIQKINFACDEKICPKLDQFPLVRHWESLPRKYSSNSSEIATGRKLLR